MFNLFFHEFARFRLFACITAMVLCVVMAVLSGIQPIMARGIEILAYQAVTLALGFVLGCSQILLHKRKGNWAFLVHRPIAPKRIYCSLVLAGVLNLAIAVLLPLFLVLLGLDVLNIDVVETRHYLFSLHVFFAAVFVYLVGIYLVLSPNKAAFLCLMLLYFIWSSDPNSAALTLAIDLGLILMMFLLGASAFKVNLTEHHQTVGSRLLAIAALHMGLMVILMMGQLAFYHLPMSMVNKHPDNYNKQQLSEDFAVLWQLTPEELIDYTVDANKYPDKQRLKQQVVHANSFDLVFRYKPLGHFGQIFHQDNYGYALVDSKNKQQWIFSHSEQLFIGKSTKNNEVVGYLSPQGFLPLDTQLTKLTASERFSSVPRIYQNKFIQVYDKIYMVDFNGRYVDLKHQLAEGEYYVNAIQQPHETKSTFLITNKAIYVIDNQLFNQESDVAVAKMTIKHTRAFQSLGYVQVFDMLDGYLFKFADRHYLGFDQPAVALLYAKYDGARIPVTEKSFKRYRPLPYWVSYQAYWMSPWVYSVLFELAEDAFKHPDDPRKQTLAIVLSHKYPSHVYWLLAGSLIVTLLLTLCLGLTCKHKKSDIAFWLFVVALFGLPGFLSFLLMNHWREFWPSRSVKAQSNNQLLAKPIKV